MKEAASVLNERKGGSSGEGREGDMERRNQTLRDVDVHLEADGSYEIYIGDWDKKDKPARNCIRAKDSKKGLLVIRAFNVPSGSTWRAPDLFDLDGSTPRPVKFQERTSGPYASKNGTSVWSRSRALLLTQALACAAQPGLTRPVLSGALAGYLLRSLAVGGLTKKYTGRRRQPEPNVAFDRIPGLGGNADHVYYTLTYDVSGADVMVEGVYECSVAPSSSYRRGAVRGIRYFNLQCYHWSSLPQEAYFDSLNVTPHVVDEEAEGGVRVTRRYKVYLTAARSGVGDELDVSKAGSSGTCTVRILLPENEHVGKVTRPKVSVVPRGHRG